MVACALRLQEPSTFISTQRALKRHKDHPFMLLYAYKAFSQLNLKKAFSINNLLFTIDKKPFKYDMINPSSLDPNRINYIDVPGSWALVFKLNKDLEDYMWRMYKEGEQESVDYRHQLAGNISRSFVLKDQENRIIGDLLNGIGNSEYEPLLKEKVINVLRATALSSLTGEGVAFRSIPYLCSLWANNQYKYEFNPPHDHAGIFSFVMWMNIPYSHENEKELPFVKGSRTSHCVGNFSFHHIHDGTLSEVILEMAPNMNGWCAFFPSTLKHSVYPFYTSDEARISISGNLSFRIDDTTLVQDQGQEHMNTSHS